MTYNCKNIEISKYAIEQLSKLADIILLQEHWYFDSQLNNLTLICDTLTGTGKAVDTGDPILPAQMPRGYGGVAILWKKTIDHLVKDTEDGANRIQCVEVHAQQPILVISVYMPCKGLHDNVDEFQDVLAQLHEIIQKYKNSHHILLGGDFNESILAQTATRMLTSFKQFLAENRLLTKHTGKTYVAPSGAEVSTIDYMFYSQSVEKRVLQTEVMDHFSTNVSDHYPVLCTMNIKLDTAKPTKSVVLPASKVRWEKVDKARYEEMDHGH